MKGGKEGIYRLKQHLAGIRGQVSPCKAPNAVKRPIRAEYVEKIGKFEEENAREKAIQAGIAEGTCRSYERRNWV